MQNLLIFFVPETIYVRLVFKVKKMLFFNFMNVFKMPWVYWVNTKIKHCWMHFKQNIFTKMLISRSWSTLLARSWIKNFTFIVKNFVKLQMVISRYRKVQNQQVRGPFEAFAVWGLYTGVTVTKRLFIYERNLSATLRKKLKVYTRTSSISNGVRMDG